MSPESLRSAVTLFVILPTVIFGGVSILTPLLRDLRRLSEKPGFRPMISQDAPVSMALQRPENRVFITSPTTC
jgi:hypothetical protein